MGLANSFLAVFVYMVGSFFTQTTDSRTAAVVEGSIINKLSGAPVKSAHVIYTRITSTTGGTVTPISADTDAGGNFTLHLPPGTYRLWVERNGFARQIYGALSSAGGGTNLTLAAGQQLSQVIFRLVPQGAIAGLMSAPEKNQKCAILHFIQTVFGADSKLVYRPDGKPEIAGSRSSNPHISLSHSGDIVLLLSTETNAGCDLEKIVSRTSGCWEELLGKEDLALAKLLTGESKTSFDAAATQVWTLKESLRKAGAGFEHPIVLDYCSEDGWNHFSAGGFTAATFHTNMEDTYSAFAFGFVLQGAA